MTDHFRVAVALRVDVPLPNHQEVFAGLMRHGYEQRSWRCVIDERPDDPLQQADTGLPPYDGVICRNTVMARRLRGRQTACVNTLFAGSTDPDIAGIYVDAERSGQLAADHLMDRGFQRLAFLGVPDWQQTCRIGDAFNKAVEDRGYECMMSFIDTPRLTSQNYWQLARDELLPFIKSLVPPVGVLTAVPWMARLLVTLCEDMSLHVPQDVAVMCTDDLKSITQFPPQITCIDLNYEQVGYEAAALLDRMMRGKKIGQRQVIVPPKGIIARESTDYFAVENEIVAEALRYVASRLAEKLDVAKIANAVNVSPRSLQRHFSTALGRPITDEIRRLRLELAKRLLRDGDMQIKQVAWQSGFGDSVKMNHVFRRELGMSPGAYRKQIQADFNPV